MGNTSEVPLLLAEGSDPWNAERVICECFSLVSQWVVVLSQHSHPEASHCCRFQRHALSPRVSPVCNVDCAVYVSLKLRAVALIVSTPECGLSGSVPDVAALVARLAGVLRSDVLDRDTGLPRFVFNAVL